MKNKRINKIGIYDPYLDTLGGGERYALSIAEYFNNFDIPVDIFWEGPTSIITTAAQRFQLNLSKTSVVKNIFLNQNILKRYQDTSKYDLIFYISDGSLPFLFSKNNFVHYQVPFCQNLSLTTKILNQLKLVFIKKIITNSRFTDTFTQKYLQTSKTSILYPPVDIAKFHSGTKKNQILSVGRFDNILNAKRQDILIKAFSNIYQQNPNLNWKLILAGGSTNPNSQYINDLRIQAQGLPVEFYINTTFENLQQLYSSSKIYWHAAGYKVDENSTPQSTEHFGMVIVEAMSAGIVPMGISKGGIPEIINHQVDGFLWDNLDQLIDQTISLISQPELLDKISKKSIITSQKFSKDQFFTNFSKLINA